MSEIEEILLGVADEIDRMDKLVSQMDNPRHVGGGGVSSAIRRTIKAYRKDRVARACIDCPAIYTGPLVCPKCGGMGEPIEIDSRVP